jgi:CHAD domain-containing protein
LVKQLPRRLFRALGVLRDLHVLEDWVRRLAAPGDPLRAALLEVLEDRHAALQEQVRRAIRAFDQEGWERLARTASKRARLISPNRLTAQCLALERYEDVRRLHARAVRTERPAPWHALRVGLKRFRYTVESLLPKRSAIWDASLGEMQGLLGQIHDLDVLRARITQESNGIDAAAAGSLRRTMAMRRQASIAEYRQRMSGDGGLLREWRAGLPRGKAIASATAARLRTTTRAMDSHRHRTAAVARLALRVYDGLAMVRGVRGFFDGKRRAILQAAARLHGIHVDGGQGSRHKAASHFLRAAPVPLGWKASEWDLLTHVIRYQRGAEPAARHKQFAQLCPELRDCVRGLAGVLRLARGLRRCGVTTSDSVRVDETAAYVRVSVSNLQDTKDTAARLATAKHLLECYLRRPIIIQSGKGAATIPGPRRIDDSPSSTPDRIFPMFDATIGT